MAYRGLISNKGVRYFGEIIKGERGIRPSEFGLCAWMLRGKGENAVLVFAKIN